MFLFKVLLTSSASAVLSAGFAIPGSYERLMFYFAYLFDCAAHGNNPTTIAPGCARYYMLQGPCDLNQFINYISQNRSNNMKVAKVTNIKFPGRPPLEVADEITRMKLAGPVRTGLIINSAKDRPYSVALAQVGQFIAEMIATAKSSRELQTMAHHAMQRALISRKAATLEAVVRDLDPGSDLEMTKVVLKNEPLYASETVTEAIDIIETAKHAGISAEEVKDALRSQDSLFHELYRFVVASGTAKSEAQGTAALLDKKIQHHIIILRYKRSLTTPAIDALSNAQEGERNVMPPRQCQIIDIEETLSLNEAPTALTADELIALLQRAGIKTFKTYAMKTVPAYQSMVEIKTIDVLGTVATLGIKPSELRAYGRQILTWIPCPVEFLEIEDMGQEKAVKDPVEGDSQTDLTTNDSMTEHAEDLSLQRAERNAHKLEEGASESPWLMNIYGAVVVGINSLAGGAAATALTVTMSDPTKIADGAGAVISAGGTPLTPSSPVFQQSVSIQEAVDVIREVLSPKKAQQILRKWAPARGKAQAQPQLVPASRKRRYPMAVESRGKPSGEEWIFQALRPALDQALLDTLQLAIDEAQREMALPVL
ncbi:hypothetical protein XA68_12344 [Ophiocordyceps unilateralis]|uniref:Uncharacterized protein n=1 Tax=Ophiocordyceps unilateralis TaxID=268505 RepID=A0A2A9PUN2_OPHUN|nr:hypothetical protein XA68_12344 [Ophiocordyceps unilateralis]